MNELTGDKTDTQSSSSVGSKGLRAPSRFSVSSVIKERHPIFGQALVYAILDACGGTVTLCGDELVYDERRRVFMETLSDGKVKVWISSGVGEY